MSKINKKDLSATLKELEEALESIGVYGLTICDESGEVIGLILGDKDFVESFDIVADSEIKTKKVH